MKGSRRVLLRRVAWLLSLAAAFGLCVDDHPAARAADAADAAHAPAADCTEDAMLVFDASGSMASAGYNELNIPRIVEALDAVREVLPEVERYRRIGLVSYGPGRGASCTNIRLHLPPRVSAARQIIDELERITPDGDTPLTEAVRQAAEALDYRRRPATVVLVTDGDETCAGEPCRLAAELVRDGARLTVHVIGFKVRDRFFEWGSVTRESRRGEVASRCLADRTGGHFVSTDTTEELVGALRRTLGCPVVTGRGAPATLLSR